MKYPDLNTKLHFCQPPFLKELDGVNLLKTFFLLGTCPELYRKVMFADPPTPWG